MSYNHIKPRSLNDYEYNPYMKKKYKPKNSK